MGGKSVNLDQASTSAYAKQETYKKPSDDASSISSKQPQRPDEYVTSSNLPKWVKPSTEPASGDACFIKLDDGETVPHALNTLSGQLARHEQGGHHLISHKKPANFGWIPFSSSRTVRANELGFYWHQGDLHVVTKQGKYPQAGPFRIWDQEAVVSLNESVITKGPLSILRLGQNVVAVAQDPTGKTFVMEQGQYVAYGNYRILEGEVQPNNLAAGLSEAEQQACIRRENTREQPILGYQRSVKERAGERNSPIAATFLQVQPNCVAVVNRGLEFAVLHTGPWMLTEKNVNVKGFFNESVTTHEMPPQRARTADNVFVDISLYMKWRLNDPLKLARDTSFDSPVAALQDAIQANLNTTVAKLFFQNAAQMRDLSGAQVNGMQQAKLLTDIQQRCSDELKRKAADMGIDLMDLEVLKCVPIGPIVEEMERLALKNTKIQNTAATIDREYDNNAKQQDFDFQLAQKSAATQKARALGDADAAREKSAGESDAAVRTAKGKKEAIVLDAEAQKEVLRLQTEGQKQQIVITAQAKLEAAKLEAESIKAIADANAYAEAAKAKTRDGFGANALSLSTLQQLGENAKILSTHLNTVVLPSNQNGEVNPLLSTVYQATIAKDLINSRNND